MIIGIASGIGNSEKKRLAVDLSKALKGPVRYIDCDVEAGDPPLLRSDFERCEPVEVLLPAVNGWACTGGGDCAEACEPQAIGLFAGMPLVFAESCTGCGDCVLVCVPRAIGLKPTRVGEVRLGMNGPIQHVQARAIPGAQRPADVVEEAMRFLERADTVVLECQAGTSRATLTAMRACDFTVVVADPTERGLEDLTGVHKAARDLGCPVGVVIGSDNKGQKGAKTIEDYCQKSKIPVLMTLKKEPEQSEVALAAMFKTIEQLHCA